MHYAPPPYHGNPYNLESPYTTAAQPLTIASLDVTGHRPTVRVYYLVASVASLLLYALGIGGMIAGFATSGGGRPDLALVFGGETVLILGALFVYVRLGLGMYWLHGAWKWLPVDQRAGRDGKRYAPNDVFLLLIPYYNFYYQFPINLALCDAMERLRQTTRTSGAPKRDTALWAAIAELVPCGNFFVSPFLWASYMRSVDVLHDEIATALSRGP